MKAIGKMINNMEKEPVFLADGDRYEGEYKDDKMNGKGTFFTANGDQREQEWTNGINVAMFSDV